LGVSGAASVLLSLMMDFLKKSVSPALLRVESI